MKIVAHQGPGDLPSAPGVAGVPGGPGGHTGGVVNYTPLEIGLIVGNLINVVVAGTITMIVALNNPLTQPYLSGKARVCFPIRFFSYFHLSSKTHQIDILKICTDSVPQYYAATGILVVTPRNGGGKASNIIHCYGKLIEEICPACMPEGDCLIAAVDIFGALSSIVSQRVPEGGGPDRALPVALVGVDGLMSIISMSASPDFGSLSHTNPDFQSVGNFAHAPLRGYGAIHVENHGTSKKVRKDTKKIKEL